MLAFLSTRAGDPQVFFRNRKKDEAMEKGKMKAYVADRLFVRRWDAWEDGKRTHVLVVDLADAKAPLRDLTPGDFDSPAFVVGGGGDFDVSPDGRELVFTSNRDPHPATSTNSDLWIVPIDGSPEVLAAPRNITAPNRAFDGSPRYSRTAARSATRCSACRATSRTAPCWRSTTASPGRAASSPRRSTRG